MDDVTIRQRPSDAGPVHENHSVHASVKVTGCASQRPGSARCEAFALDHVRAASQHWPDAGPMSGHYVTSVRSVFLSEKHFHDFATFSPLAQMCQPLSVSPCACGLGYFHKHF
jgi:hypothetical protein